ncbi:helix-turn-helix domain-containing protein [Patescibacteria group bacterium]
MSIHDKLKNLLTQAGLNHSEQLVYIELLKKPSETRWELIKRTKLDKNKVYRAFASLRNRRLVGKRNNYYKAFSLKSLVSDLNHSQRNLGKLTDKLKKISPFLRFPNESFDEFDIFYSKEHILEAYILMSEVDYDACLDFGDLENFVPILGGLDAVFKFRKNRYKKAARNHALCTTIGPYTECMARKNDLRKYKSDIDHLKINFKGKWIIFSDTNDYLMFNDFSDEQCPSSILVKSRIIADIQRMYFDQFSQNFENF